MKKLKKILFDGQPDFRIRIFNLLALGRITISYVMAVLCLLVGNDFLLQAWLTLAGTMAVFLLYYTNQSGRYQMGYLITIIVVFLIGFPILFSRAAIKAVCLVSLSSPAFLPFYVGYKESNPLCIDRIDGLCFLLCLRSSESACVIPYQVICP